MEHILYYLLYEIIFYVLNEIGLIQHLGAT